MQQPLWAVCLLLWCGVLAGLAAGNLPQDDADLGREDDTDNHGLVEVVSRMNAQQPKVDDPSFVRQVRKYSRRLWLINCSRRLRSSCHCYSRQVRQYFCCDCDSGPCFPAGVALNLPGGGSVKMANLTVGQVVVAGDNDGHVLHSKVLGFMDKRPEEEAVYTTLTTQAGHQVTLSGNHIIFVATNNQSTMPLPASLVKVGDFLWTSQNESQLEYDPVVCVKHSILKGAYVPLTEHGTLLVDGVLVSCYASFPHSLSHWALAPARLAPSLLLDTEISQHEPGVRFFPRLLKIIGHALLPVLDPAAASQVLKFDLRPYK